jgi:23S rRNA C2498 (ribose-2'-O)-methylase RlmM
MAAPAGLLLYCRAGFERECAQEITAAAAEWASRAS